MLYLHLKDNPRRECTDETMITIRLNNLTFSYPSKPILSGVNCEMQDGTVYGIIGPNGSGKTTLLKLILGELQPDEGRVLREKGISTAYMAQDVDLDAEASAFESVRSGACEILRLEARLAEIETHFADADTLNNERRLTRLIDEQHKALEDYTQAGGPGLKGNILTLLRSLGFRDEETELPVGKLSGGQKKLLGLARIMISKPGVLLLDEPDNHLDLDGKLMLEKIIRNFTGTVLIVSHDRYFLDMVVDGIIEIEAGKLNSFSGTYSEYVFDKQLKQARQAQLFQAQQHEITRLEMAAKRLLTWGKVYDNEKFSKRGMAILKRLERVERIDRPQSETRPLEINLGGWAGSRKVLEIKGVCKGFADPNGRGRSEILREVDLYLGFGERVGLIGPNGAGKSLLVKMILGQVVPDSGSIEVGPSVRIGYYSQEFETLDMRPALLETVCKAGNFNESRGIAFMRKFGFDYQQRDTRVGSLSGGERARLQIALITLSGANFLLLDEPTNHLDIPSCEVLEDALLDFAGSILAISHDRYFLDRIATRMAALSSLGLETFPGNYSEYQLQKHARERRQG
jgi:ATP-binding cassette subfamily F protein 3